jgi:preprotein translocase subunit SecY
MLKTLVNVFRVRELRNKVLFTVGMLAVFRVGHWIPLPGVNQELLVQHFQQAAADDSSAVAKLVSFVSLFSGGALSHSTIFGLGIMPYITASIIFQLLAAALPNLKKMQEEPTGRQRIQEWTRYATVGLCVVQAMGWLSYIAAQGLVHPEWRNNAVWWLMAVSALTAGTVFLMWIGEQIDKYGIGNGVSMIIMAGILAAMPGAIMDIVNNFEPGNAQKLGWLEVFALVAMFVGVIAGSVLMTIAQRRIPIQQAKHTRGRRVFGGQRSYLPLRINHGGVMPIIFASSLMIFPAVFFSAIADAGVNAASANNTQPGMFTNLMRWFANNFTYGEFPYSVLYVAMIYFFAYFWITVQFNPQEMSKQLRDHGSFIPGLRPGPRTEEYLETVMTRITFVGAAFLAVIAVLPSILSRSMNISYSVTQFLGGTGTLIVVSVCLDFLQRVEANLMMRNYAGFLARDDDSNAPRMKGPRG